MWGSLRPAGRFWPGCAGPGASCARAAVTPTNMDRTLRVDRFFIWPHFAPSIRRSSRLLHTSDDRTFAQFTSERGRIVARCDDCGESIPELPHNSADPVEHRCQTLMRRNHVRLHSVGIGAALAIAAGMVIVSAQTPPTTVDGLVSAAKVAAGTDWPGTFTRLCIPPPQGPARGRGASPGAATATPPCPTSTGAVARRARQGRRQPLLHRRKGAPLVGARGQRGDHRH